VRQARAQLREKLHDHAKQLEKLQHGLNELCDELERLELETERNFKTLEELQAPPSPLRLAAVRAAVDSLMTATLPKQVFDKLTEEAHRMGVRAVVFEVRSKAAWGASARGFGPLLSEQVVRSLVVPLSVDTPFREVFDLGEAREGNADALKQNPNILNRLKPDPGDLILLLPIRSGGAVSGIFYADSGGGRDVLPAEALKLLTQFAGAQLDRLRALGGKAAPAPSKDAVGGEEAESPDGSTRPAEAGGLSRQDVAETSLKGRFFASSSETSAPDMEEPLPSSIVPPGVEPAEAGGWPAMEPALSAALASTQSGPGPVSEIEAREAGGVSPMPSAVRVDVSQLSEADQKLHKDARRFAKLLVSEIELYYKTTVAEGRESKDLYKRMKLVIDRSRQAFGRRFGNALGKEFDYFHEELVRTLAGNDPTLLGSDYPGPST
jgi:hypothetical protein